MRLFITLLALLLLLTPIHTLRAVTPEPPPSTQPAPRHLKMYLVLLQDTRPFEHIIMVDRGGAFKTVEGFKKFIAKLPPDSSITWDPGCIRIGGEPILSDKNGVADLQAHCEAHKVKFILIPAG